MAPKRITQQKNRIPSLRHHKATGQGFVALRGTNMNIYSPRTI